MMFRILEWVFMVLFVCFILWGFISWIEVIRFNMVKDYVYQNWNLFVVFLKLAGQ